ncbi:MAG: hypothetical protein OEN02_04225 [Gammaproteobacteria bacterium]|nr:hypothetical protein [Gammaproteobacteria bacterium]MDH3537838.1 hypothetical protein [Gammaproteobacteria bacterium]
MINSVTNVAPALAGWFDPGQARRFGGLLFLFAGFGAPALAASVASLNRFGGNWVLTRNRSPQEIPSDTPGTSCDVIMENINNLGVDMTLDGNAAIDSLWVEGLTN